MEGAGEWGEGGGMCVCMHVRMCVCVCVCMREYGCGNNPQQNFRGVCVQVFFPPVTINFVLQGTLARVV